MSDLDEGWRLLVDVGAATRTTDPFLRWLDGAETPLAVVLACAERLAQADRGTRLAFGNVLALQAAARTPPGEPLDPRIDAVVGLLPAWRAQDERVYGRIPPARLTSVVVRLLEEQPLRVGPEVAQQLIDLLRRAPEATPAFIEYLRRRKELRRIQAGGDLAERFGAACASSPRIAALAGAVRGDAARTTSVEPLELVRVCEVRSAAEVAALGAPRAAQFVAALAAALGEKVASAEEAFARPLRPSEHPLLAALYEVAAGAKRYELWTFFGDTGVLFVAGTTRKAGVDWVQGSFEPSRPTARSLAQALETARWR